MPKSELTGRIQTVLGTIDPSDLGITLTHEHLLIDQICYFEMPEEASEREWVDAKVTMDRLGKAYRRGVRHFPDAIQLLDIDEAIREVLKYKHVGGNSLMDTTNVGIARDPSALARISRATGLNIIMGSGYYVPVSYPQDMDTKSEQSITDEIIRDITVGVGDTGVRSGFIGEIGNFWPTNPNTIKVLQASAHAALETGAVVLIHPGFDPDSPPAIIETLTGAGLDPSRIIMGHLELIPTNFAWLKDLAQSGCYLEWDIFGWEDTKAIIPLISDVERMENIEYAISEGFGDKILVGSDVCTKTQYTKYGGKGYAHILENIVPRMRKRGFTEESIQSILVGNPKNAVTFV